MRRVARSIDVRRDAAAAWQLVGDLSRYDEFVVGTTRWEHVGPDRYAVMMQVGAIAAGGEVAVAVDPARRRVHWDTIRGTGHVATLQVEPLGAHRSRLRFEVEFALVGLFARLTERLAATLVARNLVATLETARHLLEHPPSGEPEPRPGGDARDDDVPGEGT